MDISKAFTDNDIYFIEALSNEIIINDNYSGVFILDYELNIKKDIKVLDDLSIDVSFVKDDEIVLYCFENRILVYINANTYIYKIISLNEELNDIVFLPLYEWAGDDLMLLSNDGNISIHVDLLKGTAEIVRNEDVDSRKFLIHKYWTKLSKKIIHKVYPSVHSAVLESNDKMVLYNYQEDKETILAVDLSDFHNDNLPSGYIYHDIEVKNEALVEVSEKKVLILYKNEKISLYPESIDYSFWRGKFITVAEKICLILLQCSNSDSQKSRINIYNMESLFE